MCPPCDDGQIFFGLELSITGHFPIFRCTHFLTSPFNDLFFPHGALHRRKKHTMFYPTRIFPIAFFNKSRTSENLSNFFRFCTFTGKIIFLKSFRKVQREHKNLIFLRFHLPARSRTKGRANISNPLTTRLCRKQDLESLQKKMPMGVRTSPDPGFQKSSFDMRQIFFTLPGYREGGGLNVQNSEGQLLVA